MRRRVDASVMLRTSRETVFATLIAIALSIAFTWPLASVFERSGRIDSGDGRFSVWNVAWVANALTTAPKTLYDANIFYPYHGALATSEPNIVAGVMAVPAWWLTRNAMAATNSVTIASFALAALAMFALVRRLTGSRAGGAFAGILFAFCPYTFSHSPHVQLLLTFGLPLCLLALHRFVDRPDVRRGVELGGALALQGLACGYYGIFAALMVGWGLLWFGANGGLWRARQFWLGVGAAVMVGATIVGPFFLPMLTITAEGFTRSLADARLFAADWRSYFASPMVFHRWMLPLLSEWRSVLFPGFATVIFATVAALRTWGPLRRPTRSVAPPVIGFYVSVALLALWASFGPDAGLYTALFKLLPVFSFIRAADRFGLLVTLALAVLAGVALADVQRHLKPFRRVAFVGLVLMYAVARSTVGPLDLTEFNPGQTVYRRLAQLPAGAVAEFPYYSNAVDRHRHTEYMLASTVHWKPLINGYSDHYPPQAWADMSVLATFPSEAAWAALERRRARYVVMHWNKFDPGQSPHVEIRTQLVGTRLRTIVDGDEVGLFEIIPAMSARAEPAKLDSSAH